MSTHEGGMDAIGDYAMPNRLSSQACNLTETDSDRSASDLAVPRKGCLEKRRSCFERMVRNSETPTIAVGRRTQVSI